MSDTPIPAAPRARLRLPNVRAALAAEPWAILPDKLQAILAVVDAHAQGAALPAVTNVYAARREAARGASRGAVAVLPIYGVLTQRAGLMSEYSGGTSAEAIGAQFDAMVADASVSTIVLDIDSPGGSTAGIPELAAKLYAARGTKKVIAVCNSLCASAAYYLAAQADEIVAAPGAIVGSIGVYAVHTDTSVADAQAGVTHQVITFGANKADGLCGPLSADGVAAMQAIVDEQGKAFVAAVAKGRGITAAQVRAEFGDGGVFAAKAAVSAGLVDRVASFEDVLASLGASRPRAARDPMRAEARTAPDLSLAADLGGGSFDAAAIAAALTASPDARAGAFGDLPTALTTPAPQARSHPVSDTNTAAPGAASTTSDIAAALAADRQRASDVIALALEHNVDAATANSWAISGMSVADAGLKVLALRTAASQGAPRISVGTDRAAAQPFASLADQLKAVVNSAKTGEADKRLLHVNAASGSASTVSSDGGFLIQTDLAPGLQARMWDSGQILSRVTQTPVSGNGLRVNVLKENSRANGSRNGGIQGYWGAEASTITATKGAVRQVETPLNKVFAAWYATDELLEDAPAMESEVNRLVPAELTFQLEDKIVNGTGAGVPMGILNSPALISVAIESTQTIANSAQFFPINFAKMFARLTPGSAQRAVWFVNQEIMASVMTMTLGAGAAAIPVWLPNNSLTGAPNGTILGRPVVPVEYCAAQGTVGDILLADLEDYRVINKGGVQGAGSIHVQFLTDEQVFRWTYRVGGQPQTNSPVTPYKGTATLSPYIALAARS